MVLKKREEKLEKDTHIHTRARAYIYIYIYIYITLDSGVCEGGDSRLVAWVIAN